MLKTMASSQVDYHSDRDHASRSDLVQFAFSPKGYKRRRDLNKPEDKEVFRIGTGTHAVALKDTIGLNNILLVPDEVLSANGQQRGNAFTKFRLKHRGKTLLTAKQWELCNKVADQLQRVEVAQTASGRSITVGDFVANPDAQRELEVRWNEIIPCRLKADLVVELPDLVICLDLKTARSVEPRAFWREIQKRKLWLQVAHYSAGLEQKFKKPVRFVFVAIEKTEPYDADLFEMGKEAVALAKRGRLALLEQLRECQETGVFIDPPKPGGIKVLEFTAADMGIAE